MAVENTLTIGSLSAFDYLTERRGVSTAPALTGGSITALDVANAVRCKAATFTEAGDTTYTWSPVIPADAIILDIGIVAEAVWDDGTSASMKVGINGDDDDTFFTAVDLKATDLTAGQSVAFDKTGGVEGASASGTATHWDDRMATTSRTIDFIVTTGGQNGSAGVTHAYIIWIEPTMETPVAA